MPTKKPPPSQGKVDIAVAKRGGPISRTNKDKAKIAYKKSWQKTK